MLLSLTTLFETLSSIFHSCAALELENLALRHPNGHPSAVPEKTPEIDPVLFATPWTSSGRRVDGDNRLLTGYTFRFNRG
jgi:hypothetical protein